MTHQSASINGSCGKRGCDSRDLILPHDGSALSFLSGLHGAGNDIPQVLPLADLLVDKEPKEREQEMAGSAESLRDVRLLQRDLDPYYNF